LTLSTLFRLDAQVQFERPVNPPDSLVVPCKAFDIAQIKETQTKAPGAKCCRQTNQPVGNLGILLAQFALIAIADFAELERPATGTSLSPCFKIVRIWLSVNRDFFISFSKRIKGRRSPIFNPVVSGGDYPESSLKF
jgi:hypothetical protein